MIESALRIEPYQKEQFYSSGVDTSSRLRAIQYLDQLRALSSENGVTTFTIEDEIRTREARIAERLRNPVMQGLPRNISMSDVDTRTAGSFYAELIKPMVAKAKDAYKPTDEDIMTFCERLQESKGVDMVLYYALSKTQSPRRTGSPDMIIDNAEIEMLKNYALISRVGQNLGMKMRFVLIDETDIMPIDNYLGLTAEQKQINKAVAQTTIGEFKAENGVLVRSLADSVLKPLEENGQQKYEQNFDASIDQVMKQLESSETPLELNATYIRIFTLLDCMPDKGLTNIGITDEQIALIRQQGRNLDLTQLPQPLFNYLIGMTAHIDAIMGLREETKQKVRETNQEAEYPEYQVDRVYGGVTRKLDRWSFLPHPKRYRGRIVNPMHGLALYDPRKEFAGVTHYSDILGLRDTGEADILSIAQKPVFGLIRG